jgi:hypothetical protein
MSTEVLIAILMIASLWSTMCYNGVMMVLLEIFTNILALFVVASGVFMISVIFVLLLKD